MSRNLSHSDRGFAATKELIYVAIIFGMLAMAGYIYVFSGKTNNLNAPAPLVPAVSKKILFRHPVYNYRLDLPFAWKDKYSVLEDGDKTVFYLNDLGDLPVFAIQAGLNSSSTVVNNIGEDKETAFFLNFGTATSSKELETAISQIGDSFKLETPDREQLMLHNLVKHFGSGTTSRELPFIAFETLSTKENASSTDYYIWVLRKIYSTQYGYWKDWRKIDGPALLSIDKGDNSMFVKSARPGKLLAGDTKKIFPQALIESPIFASDTPEHAALLDRLEIKLKDATLAYFGQEPLLTRLAFIDQIKKENGSLLL